MAPKSAEICVIVFSSVPSADPIGISGGLNLYAYAGNDPVNHDDPGGTDPMVWCEMAEKTFDYADTEYVNGRPRRVYHYTQYFDCHVVGGVLPVSAPGGTLTKNPNPLPHSADEPAAPSCTVQKVLIAGAFGADVVQGVSLLDGMGEILGGLRLLGEGTLSQVGRAAVGGIAVRTVGGLPLCRSRLRVLPLPTWSKRKWGEA